MPLCKALNMLKIVANTVDLMQGQKKIKTALISVFYKDGLEPLVRQLNDLGVEIYSTGGTQKFIEDLGINVNRVEDLTS